MTYQRNCTLPNDLGKKIMIAGIGRCQFHRQQNAQAYVPGKAMKKEKDA